VSFKVLKYIHAYLKRADLPKEVAQEFVNQYGQLPLKQRQEALQEFVNQRGIRDDDLRDLMYDLQYDHRMPNLQKPQEPPQQEQQPPTQTPHSLDYQAVGLVNGRKTKVYIGVDSEILWISQSPSDEVGFEPAGPSPKHMVHDLLPLLDKLKVALGQGDPNPQAQGRVGKSQVRLEMLPDGELVISEGKLSGYDSITFYTSMDTGLDVIEDLEALLMELNDHL